MCELELPQAPYVCVCYFTLFATTQYRNSITKLIYLIFSAPGKRIGLFLYFVVTTCPRRSSTVLGRF